jgi:hypothetical protein
MKRRVFTAACVLSLSLPAVLADVGLGSLALAQQQPATDQVTEAARQKYQEGVKAFEAGKYEDARAAFLQAYALKRVPAVLLNLGQSEIRSGHHEEGGNHLQQFIREHKGASQDQVTAAETGIADAKKKTGFLIVIVNAVGAELSVDSVVIGKTPLLDPYFIKPGKHVLYATFQGSAATTAVDVKKGVATSATLTLAVTTPVPTAPVPTAPVPTAPVPTAPTAPVPTAPVPTYTAPAPTYPQPYPSSTAPYVAPTAYDPLAPPASTFGPDQTNRGREPIFTWFKRKPIAWVGAGATVIGLGMGIGFSAAAGLASSNIGRPASGTGPNADKGGYATQIANQAKADLAKYPSTTFDTLAAEPCGKEADPNDDWQIPGGPNYHQPCEKLRESLGAYRTDVALAATGWVLFGLGAIGTTVYALVDWYPKKGGAAQGPQVTGFAPIFGPGQGGATLIGVF